MAALQGNLIDPGDVMEQRDQAKEECDRIQQQRDRPFAKLREMGIDPEQL